MCLSPVQGQMGQFQSSVPVQDIKVSCWHQPGIGAALLVVRGKGWGSPCDVPAGLVRVNGDSRGWWDSGSSIRVGQETSHPHNIPLSPCSLSHCLSLSGFPAHCRFQLLCFPGKPICWQTGWLSAGLAPAKDCMGLWVRAGPGAGPSSLLGAAAHPGGFRSPGHPSCPG